jgi:hypothetical protein
MRRFALIAASIALLGVPVAYAAHGPGVKTPGVDKVPPKKGKTAPKPQEDDAKIGYSNDEIQLNGMMVPVHTASGGTDYEVLVVRLQVAPGENARPACFMAPIVHEKMLMYLAAAHLEKADFEGQRRDVIAKDLFDVAVKTTDRGYYTGVTLVDETSPALDSKSQTLSSQCR